MSLPTLCTQAALFTTLTTDFFGPEDRYRIFSQKILPVLLQSRDQLAGAYCANNGRPASEPVIMAGVTMLQFWEGIPDRQAVEMLRYHLGWNFALNRTVDQPLFHPTALVYFRGRLVDKKLDQVVFAKVLQALVDNGLVERRGKQRLDSTQILGHVARMSRLENVRESLRLALQELEAKAARFAKPDWWTALWDCYVSSKLDYRLEASALKEKMDRAGLDALQLLNWVAKLSDPTLAQAEKVQLLKRVLEENFQWDQAGVPAQRESQPAGAVHNPHDPEAQWAAKGQGKQKKEHVGYKVQVAESVVIEPLAAGEPTRSFITAIATQPAIASDEAGAKQVEQEQAAMGLEKPSEQYVDSAYVSGERLAQAQSEGRQILGPAQSAPSRDGRFSSEDFQVDVQRRRAICPNDQPSTQCSRLEEKETGKVSYRFEWSYHCKNCPLRAQCIGKGQPHRTLTVGQYHTEIQARRQEQKTQAFKDKAKHRNAIEGTQSELVRAHGLRRARYRGLEKTRLQNYFIGAACNAKRWIRRVIWELHRAHVGAKVSVATG